MYLKSLHMQGFKSFVDKTSMDFTNGITAIVGPNGSGKSNISDAIRWVMGEQSAKSLRGGNMQDIIFSGTKKRKPLGFAEVSLVVDNSSKRLPIDYDEVAITRRVFRSGESEYFINKASCRLKDIHELFMDTGVGRDGYSIIGQGKIAEIINSKPEDRRQMFEEAAGITKYRYHKEEAQRKLANTEENILRVNDIVGEIEARLEPLRLQSEKAEVFISLQQQLKNLEVNVSLQNIDRCNKTLKDAQDIFDGISSQLDDVKAQIEAIEKRTADMYDNIQQSDEDMEKCRAKEQENTTLLANLQSDIAVLKNRVEQNLQSVKQINIELDELTEKLYEVEDLLAEQGKNVDAVIQKDSDFGKQIQALESDAGETNSDKEKLIGDVQQINSDIMQKESEIVSFKSRISNFETLIQSMNSRAADIEKELQGNLGLFENAAEKLQQTEQEHQLILKQQSEYSEQHNNCIEEIEKLELAARDAAQSSRNLQMQLHQAKTRHKLLLDMEKSFERYSHSVKTVMKAKQDGKLSGLFSTVAQLVKAPEKFAVAIETALGGAAQNIVSETEKDAKAAIEYLKRHKAGRATFLPISAVKGGVLSEPDLNLQKGFIGIASSIAEAEPKFKKVVESLLGRVAVADNIDNAIALARKYNYRFRIVTLQGELLSPGGSMSGGSRTANTGFLTLANERSQLNTRVAQLEKESDDSAKQEEKCLSQLSEMKNQSALALERLRQAERQSAVLSAEIKHSKEFLQTNQKAKDTLIAEKERLIQKISSSESEIADCHKQTENLFSQIEGLKEAAEKRKQEADELAALHEQKAKRIIDLKMEHSNIKKDVELCNERIKTLEMRKNEIEHSIEQKRMGLEEITDKNEDLKEDIEFKTRQTEELQEETKNLKQSIAQLVEKRKSAEGEIKITQKTLGEKRDTQLALQQEQSRAESKTARANDELENIINHLWNEYELTVSSAAQYKTEIGSIAKAQKSIGSLKEKIRDLGNVNVEAISEYANIKERFEFLTSQRDDLTRAAKNLEKVIFDIEKIMRERFSAKFSDINERFSEMFTELFGGGTARLILTQEDDVLTSGVDIDVQPPGKAVKSMLQLSGGEQAFVSIALLFAILKVRPSPFCIFDEIEAALDEVNVYRFADFLKGFAKDAQFIVVTHRRGTMEAANMLYGVTMQEQGVTSLISLNVDDIKLA
ncbi:MAG: chromosome segregation protein SMC [Firmicutes bacterium]|nr:chromosome segregation protein SMC [Bacillota bacterium]